MKVPPQITIAVIHLLASTTTAFTFQNKNTGCKTALQSEHTDDDIDGKSRRTFLVSSLAGALTALTQTVIPVPNSDAADLPGLLPDLPPDAVKSYLQYRISLQTSADYYLWDLQEKIGDTDEWGQIGELFQTNNNKGQGQPNKIERDFTNPMRILALSMPPDIADDMRDAQFKFERVRFVRAPSSFIEDSFPIRFFFNFPFLMFLIWLNGTIKTHMRSFLSTSYLEHGRYHKGYKRSTT